ncbi:MAG: hypothetical protein KDD35_07020, partial [Bdellovibrionales bacterium]|nr:hypothetical protein [Bdellovibrionales bacterium]
MNVKLTHKKWQFLCRKPACGFLVGLLVISTGLSSCRLDDNRIRGSYGPYPERGSGSDGTPDSFSFVAQSGLALSTLVESEIVPIVGIDKKVDIEVTGSGNSEYRVCSDSACAQEIKSWGAIAESSLVSQNNYVQIRLTSSSSYSTTVQAILSVGQTSASWEVTCLAAVTPLAEASWNQIVSGGSHT